jgi:Caspase domain
MRRALVVGIDHYADFSALSDLEGCTADAQAVGQLLRRNHDGSVNFEVQELLSTMGAPVAGATLLERIDKLLKKPAEAAVLFFAGHGTQNERDGYLVASDAARFKEGVSMTEVLQLAKDSPVHDIVIVLDCCQAGAFGTPPVINAGALLRDGLSVLTATRSTEAAVEQDGRGLFSGLVCAALEGGAADTRGKVTVASVYAYVEEALGAWDQRPQLKANVSQLLVLRQAQDSVALENLQALTTWFPTIDAELPLDPSYEPTEEPRDEEHEQTFEALQKMRASKLVEPVGEQHMYFAAIHSTACRMTRLGRLYWQQVKDGKL